MIVYLIIFSFPFPCCLWASSFFATTVISAFPLFSWLPLPDTYPSCLFLHDPERDPRTRAPLQAHHVYKSVACRIGTGWPSQKLFFSCI